MTGPNVISQKYRSKWTGVKVQVYRKRSKIKGSKSTGPKSYPKSHSQQHPEHHYQYQYFFDNFCVFHVHSFSLCFVKDATNIKLKQLQILLYPNNSWWRFRVKQMSHKHHNFKKHYDSKNYYSEFQKASWFKELLS